MKTIMILGATGAVGQALLHLALSNPKIERVIAPSRKALLPHQKLENPIVDFAYLPEDATWWKCDAVVCALGSTIAKAGSQKAFFTIDHDYVLNAATLAYHAETPCFVYNSSLGANANASSFYLQTKGKIEQSINALHFISTYHFRPSLLIAPKRSEFRFSEFCAILFFKLFTVFIPQTYKAINVEDVAQAMLLAALDFKEGLHVISSGDITRN